MRGDRRRWRRPPRRGCARPRRARRRPSRPARRQRGGAHAVDGVREVDGGRARRAQQLPAALERAEAGPAGDLHRQPVGRGDRRSAARRARPGAGSRLRRVGRALERRATPRAPGSRVWSRTASAPPVPAQGRVGLRRDGHGGSVPARGAPSGVTTGGSRCPSGARPTAGSLRGLGAPRAARRRASRPARRSRTSR